MFGAWRAFESCRRACTELGQTTSPVLRRHFSPSRPPRHYVTFQLKKFPVQIRAIWLMTSAWFDENFGSAFEGRLDIDALTQGALFSEPCSSSSRLPLLMTDVLIHVAHRSRCQGNPESDVCTVHGFRCHNNTWSPPRMSSSASVFQSHPLC